MLLIEIAHPAGRLTPADHDLLGEAVVGLFLAPEGHAEETSVRARGATHIAFRELSGWRTGHGVPAADAAPPLIITVTVPRSWRDEAGGTFIGLLRHAVRRLDDARGWHRTEGSLWVRVVGVADGDIGLDGRPATGADVVDFLTEDFRSALANGSVAPPPAGKLLDPVCGMTVPDGRGAIVLEHDGRRWGFCAAGCRDAYLREHPAAVA
ncbi:YHS domain-containing protein [Occultella glacieicola]|uniref:YHS domain-containing protein n=1 Tax=Occultella glacieicola TaxID=2518684 RepID=A0ABY2DZA1_9MICO|nr:YHS domain-containing protein [Occultella glacieicola]TDE90018.1 YHS domain-containing protein [Occultella glacieicola]